jgi:L-lactate dehydrogenase
VSARYAAAELRQLATEILTAAGLAEDRADIVARGFLEADLMGFTTHGLARIPANVRWLVEGRTRKTGEPAVLHQAPAAASWDACFLPGPYVMHLAVAEAAQRATQQGVYVLTLRRAQHIACLASYLVPIVERGLIGLVVASTPGEAFVSPYGGSTPLFSNNPIAFAAPGEDAPVLFDVSTAITAGGQVARARQESRLLSEAALKDASGRTSVDPSVLGRGGSVMPIGGASHGYKGYALTLMTEILTQVLPGYGVLAGGSDGAANSVFIQVLDPAAFGEPRNYQQEMANLFRRVHNSSADQPSQPVRIPGERAWTLRRKRLTDGVDLYPGVLDGLLQCARDLNVSSTIASINPHPERSV